MLLVMYTATDNCDIELFVGAEHGLVIIDEIAAEFTIKCTPMNYTVNHTVT